MCQKVVLKIVTLLAFDMYDRQKSGISETVLFIEDSRALFHHLLECLDMQA